PAQAPAIVVVDLRDPAQPASSLRLRLESADGLVAVAPEDQQSIPRGATVYVNGEPVTTQTALVEREALKLKMTDTLPIQPSTRVELRAADGTVLYTGVVNTGPSAVPSIAPSIPTGSHPTRAAQ